MPRDTDKEADELRDPKLSDDEDDYGKMISSSVLSVCMEEAFSDSNKSESSKSTRLLDPKTKDNTLTSESFRKTTNPCSSVLEWCMENTYLNVTASESKKNHFYENKIWKTENIHRKPLSVHEEMDLTRNSYNDSEKYVTKENKWTQTEAETRQTSLQCQTQLAAKGTYPENRKEKNQHHNHNRECEDNLDNVENSNKPQQIFIVKPGSTITSSYEKIAPLHSIQTLEDEAKTTTTTTNNACAKYVWTGNMERNNFHTSTISQKIFVGGIPFCVTRRDLSEIFLPLGLLKIMDVKSVREQTFSTNHNHCNDHANVSNSTSTTSSASMPPLTLEKQIDIELAHECEKRSFCYLVFKDEICVYRLLQYCSKLPSNETQSFLGYKYFFNICRLLPMNHYNKYHSEHYIGTFALDRIHQIQIVPWVKSDNFFVNPDVQNLLVKSNMNKELARMMKEQEAKLINEAEIDRFTSCDHTFKIKSNINGLSLRTPVFTEESKQTFQVKQAPKVENTNTQCTCYEMHEQHGKTFAVSSSSTCESKKTENDYEADYTVSLINFLMRLTSMPPKCSVTSDVSDKATYNNFTRYREHHSSCAPVNNTKAYHELRYYANGVNAENKNFSYYKQKRRINEHAATPSSTNEKTIRDKYNDLKSTYENCVFVGGIHGAMIARDLYAVMRDLFKNVAFVLFESDDFGYPTGYGRVCFLNRSSFKKAVSAKFLTIQCKGYFKKIVQVEPFIYLQLNSTNHQIICDKLLDVSRHSQASTKMLHLFCASPVHFLQPLQSKAAGENEVDKRAARMPESDINESDVRRTLLTEESSASLSSNSPLKATTRGILSYINDQEKPDSCVTTQYSDINVHMFDCKSTCEERETENNNDTLKYEKLKCRKKRELIEHRSDKIAEYEIGNALSSRNDDDDEARYAFCKSSAELFCCHYDCLSYYCKRCWFANHPHQSFLPTSSIKNVSQSLCESTALNKMCHLNSVLSDNQKCLNSSVHRVVFLK